MSSPHGTGPEQNGKMRPQSGVYRSPRMSQLRRELKEKGDILLQKDADLQHRQRIIDEKDMELAKLRKEIHELKCVVQQTAHKSSILSMIQEDREMAASISKPATKDTMLGRKGKRMAVSGESSSKVEEDTKKELERHPKDFRLVICTFLLSKVNRLLVKFSVYLVIDSSLCFASKSNFLTF